MAKKLTDFSLRHLKAGSKRREVPDGGCAGLYLILQPAPSTARSWCVRYRYGGRPRKLTLGSLPGVPLSEARVRAAAALAEVAKSTDPIQTAKAAKRLAREQAIAQSGNSVERLAGLYIQHAQQDAAQFMVGGRRRVPARSVAAMARPHGCRYQQGRCQGNAP